MINKRFILYFFLLALGTSSLLGGESEGAAYDFKTVQFLIDNHPAQKLEAAVVRAFILNSVRDTKSLSNYFVSRDLEEELPWELDLVVPFTWPQIQTSQYEGPHARLGNWKLFFGAEISMSSKYGPMNPYMMRKVVLIEKKYGENKDIVECTRIILEPKWINPSSAWERGKVRELALAGWSLSKYEQYDKGAYFKSEQITYIDCGGTLHDPKLGVLPRTVDKHLIEPVTREYVVRKQAKEASQTSEASR